MGTPSDIGSKASSEDGSLPFHSDDSANSKLQQADCCHGFCRCLPCPFLEDEDDEPLDTRPASLKSMMIVPDMSSFDDPDSDFIDDDSNSQQSPDIWLSDVQLMCPASKDCCPSCCLRVNTVKRTRFADDEKK